MYLQQFYVHSIVDSVYLKLIKLSFSHTYV